MAGATGRGWWTEYKQTLSPQLLDLAEVEQAATGHRSFEWLYVPGLLQTADYMRALFRSSNTGASADLLERYAEFRSRRQQILTREPNPTVHVVIHEAAFHMGFVSSEIRAAQLEHLIEASLAPNVTIQLLPFSTPSNPAALGAFTILDAVVPELRTVNVEQPTSSLFLAEPSEIEQFTAHFDRLSRVALAPLDPTSPYGEDTFGLVQYLLYALKEDKHVRP
ncbi:DUF5753 domain-containing protein [Streptomyces sp. B6B3]|uniref:DUF5753 domain-containing protein n=1 Tax=Streptomyces sp. B6B3 TaxID=3153570 RepID=UPI00325D1EFB